MPEHCLSMRCIDCESHAIVGGKLDCNYMNRLGLSQPTVKTFLDDAESPEKIDAQIKDTQKRIDELKAETEKLKTLKKERGIEGEKKDVS